MKRLKIITLLLLVAAFSFSQTNATFKNLDIRGTSKFRGLVYAPGIPYQPIQATEMQVLLIDTTNSGKIISAHFNELADSLSPFLLSYWRLDTPDTIKTDYNVVVDSSFKMVYDSAYLGFNAYATGEPNNLFMGFSRRTGTGYLDTMSYFKVTNYGNGLGMQNDMFAGCTDPDMGDRSLSYIQTNWDYNTINGTNITLISAFINPSTFSEIYMQPDSVAIVADELTINANDSVIITSDSIIMNGNTTINGDLTVTGFLKLTPAVNPPSPATEGMIYSDTDHHLYYYDGSNWKQLD